MYFSKLNVRFNPFIHNGHLIIHNNNNSKFVEISILTVAGVRYILMGRDDVFAKIKKKKVIFLKEDISYKIIFEILKKPEKFEVKNWSLELKDRVLLSRKTNKPLIKYPDQVLGFLKR